MITKTKKLMQEARVALRGKWKTAILVLIVHIMVFYGLSLIFDTVGWFNKSYHLLRLFRPFLFDPPKWFQITAITRYVYGIVLGGPLALGLIIVFLNISRNNNPQIHQYFRGFKLFLKVLMANLFIIIFITLITLCTWTLIFLEGLLEELGFTLNLYFPILTILDYYPISIPATLWALLLTILGIMATLSYSLLYYTIVDNPHTNIIRILMLSRRMMRGHRLRLLYLMLRFVPWIILCILTIGIGFLWLVPYMITTFTKFYDDIKANYTPEKPRRHKNKKHSYNVAPCT